MQHCLAGGRRHQVFRQCLKTSLVAKASSLNVPVQEIVPRWGAGTCHRFSTADTNRARFFDKAVTSPRTPRRFVTELLTRSLLKVHPLHQAFESRIVSQRIQRRLNREPAEKTIPFCERLFEFGKCFVIITEL